MANDVNEGIETVLIMISSTTEQIGNMKKELKHTIYETVSTLRKLFIKLKEMNDSKTKTISELEMLVANTKAELDGVINITAWSTISYSQARTSMNSRQGSGVTWRGADYALLGSLGGGNSNRYVTHLQSHPRKANHQTQ
jgi:hypothetical protein